MQSRYSTTSNSKANRNCRKTFDIAGSTRLRFDCLFRCSEIHSSVSSTRSKLLFDAQQLVILSIALGTTRSPRLDLTSTQADTQVCNEHVFSFARTVRHHETPACLLAHRGSLY